MYYQRSVSILASPTCTSALRGTQIRSDRARSCALCHHRTSTGSSAMSLQDIRRFCTTEISTCFPTTDRLMSSLKRKMGWYLRVSVPSTADMTSKEECFTMESHCTTENAVFQGRSASIRKDVFTRSETKFTLLTLTKSCKCIRSFRSWTPGVDLIHFDRCWKS